MLSLNNTQLTFMISTPTFKGKSKDLRELKHEAVQKSKWAKGETRTYLLYLVHEDTKFDGQEIIFPSSQACETALFLGEI